MNANYPQLDSSLAWTKVANNFLNEWKELQTTGQSSSSKRESHPPLACLSRGVSALVTLPPQTANTETTDSNEMKRSYLDLFSCITPNFLFDTTRLETMLTPFYPDEKNPDETYEVKTHAMYTVSHTYILCI